MEISQIIPHVESLIFAADRPLPVLEITDLLNNAMAFLEDRATLDQVETALEAVREKYSSEFYAFEVRESGGGYQFLTKRDYYQTVAQLNGEKFLKRLSTAALETLAIIAYKQPISKGEIEHIRGVSTDYSIQKLLEKELIVISGRSELLPGKPLLYTTSKAFMDYFGLNSAKDLPKLKEVFDEDVSPTLMLDLDANGNTIDPEALTDEPMSFIVSETGELIEEELSPVIAGVVTDETLEELREEGLIIEEVPEEKIAEEITVPEDTIAEDTVTEDTVIEDTVIEDIVTEETPEAVVDNGEEVDAEEDEEESDEDDDAEEDDSDDTDDEENEDDSDKEEGDDDEEDDEDSDDEEDDSDDAEDEDDEDDSDDDEDEDNEDSNDKEENDSKK
jgi:segregation and condensation protein B